MTDLHEGSKQKLSTLAMLVDCLMKYEGLSTTRELCERTGKTDSHIRKARREIAERSNMTGQIAPAVKYDRSNTTEPGQIPPQEELGTLPALNTESPTEILFASKGGCGGSFEIPGLNGATGALVDQLACLLAGPLGSPNFLDAREILSSQVAAYGPEKVRAAMAEWQVKVRLKKSNPTLSTFLGFCKNAKTHFENQNDTRNILDVLAEMDAREAIQ